MTTEATWNAIVAAAMATEGCPIDAHLSTFIHSAEQNAHDTIAEKEATADDYYDLCIGSLGSLLAFCEDEVVTEFYTAQGVRW